MNRFPKNISDLLLRYADGTIDQQELCDLRSWALQSQDNQAILDLISGNSELGEDIVRMMEYDRDRVWKNIVTARSRKRSRTIKRILIAGCSVAAILTLGVFGVLWQKEMCLRQDQEFMASIAPGKKEAVLKLSDGRIVQITNNNGAQIREKDNTCIDINEESIEVCSDEKSFRTEQPSWSTLEVPSGGEFSLILSDGTKVWLNSESSITFPTQFSGEQRNISLSGEAYFEVAHNPSKPFIVKTHDMTIKVLGTVFNVQAYMDEDRTETTLINGMVRVESGGIEHQLSPGDQIALNHVTGQTSIRKVYAETYACWTKGMFVFFDEPIESLCRKLSRWYNVEIDASNQSIKNIRFSGIIRKYEMFIEIQQILSATNEVRFTTDAGKIRVLPAYNK